MMQPQRSPSTTVQAPLSVLQEAARSETFRVQLQSNPVAALQQFGIQFDPKNIPSSITLPAKSECEKYSASDAVLVWYGFFN